MSITNLQNSHLKHFLDRIVRVYNILKKENLLLNPKLIDKEIPEFKSKLKLLNPNKTEFSQEELIKKIKTDIFQLISNNIDWKKIPSYIEYGDMNLSLTSYRLSLDNESVIGLDPRAFHLFINEVLYKRISLLEIDEKKTLILILMNTYLQPIAI